MFSDLDARMQSGWTGALASPWGRFGWTTVKGLNLEFQIYPWSDVPHAGSSLFIVTRKPLIGLGRARTPLFMAETEDLYGALSHPGFATLIERHGPLELHLRRYRDDRQQRHQHMEELWARQAPTYTDLDALADVPQIA